MYCQRCQQFQDHIGLLINHGGLPSDGTDNTTASITWPTYEMTLFQNTDELESAAQSKCSVCRCVFNCLEVEELKRFRQHNCATVLLLVENRGRPSLRVKVERRDLDSAPIIELVRMIANYAPDLDNSSTGLWETLAMCSQLNNDSTGSPASVELAKYWMRECLTNHSQCSRPSSGWLPTRVIDVGSRDGSVDPRLIITADVQFECTQEEQRYVSLSHCWGKEHIITTTMANIEDRKSVIRLNELPQTFQDAILITRSLGERFLWIDSLCIIQDAIEDWRSESVQMCTIYQRAVVTIMAAHANGGGQGCFVSRDGLAQTPFRMKFKNADQEIMATACFLPLSRMSADVSYPRPLFSRAWVLQEQAISRARLIYFGEQVYWECQSARGSERNPDGGTILSGLTNFTKATVAADDPFAGEEPKDAQEFMENMHQQWCVLVENYMQRGITKTSDRLIAVDGLAQAVQERTTNIYLAGLWRNQLLMGLMWFIPWNATESEQWVELSRSHPTFLSSRHDRPLAPTWSWASVTFPIEWPFLHEIKSSWMNLKILCEILQADVHGTPFEQAGTITVRGMTRTLFVDPCYQTPYFIGQTSNPKLQEFGIHNRDYRPQWAWAICRSSTKKLSNQHQYGTLPMEFLPDELIDPFQPVTFIALGEVPAIPPANSDSFYLSRPTVITLALLPTGKRPNEYRRVGLAQFRNCSWYGYFCVGDNYDPQYWSSLQTAHVSGGWRYALQRFVNICLVWILGKLFLRPIVYRPRDGNVSFRELAVGKWGRHAHAKDSRSKKAYRKGWEPKTETITIV